MQTCDYKPRPPPNQPRIGPRVCNRVSRCENYPKINRPEVWMCTHGILRQAGVPSIAYSHLAPSVLRIKVLKVILSLACRRRKKTYAWLKTVDRNLTQFVKFLWSLCVLQDFSVDVGLCPEITVYTGCCLFPPAPQLLPLWAEHRTALFAMLLEVSAAFTARGELSEITFHTVHVTNHTATIVTTVCIPFTLTCWQVLRFCSA